MSQTAIFNSLEWLFYPHKNRNSCLVLHRVSSCWKWPLTLCSQEKCSASMQSGLVWVKCLLLWPQLIGNYYWKSAHVVNSHLVYDPTIWQPSFDLPRQQWSLLNRYCREQRHCCACKKKWRLTDTYLCPCGETQTMSHIVESCLIKLNNSLSRLHSAAEDTVSWLTIYDSWHAYEKKKIGNY